MSETVSLEFIGRRLDAVQVDVADVRRRMARLVEDIHELKRRFASLELAFDIQVQRMDAMVERQSKQEELLHRVLLLTERMALAQGISDAL
jgi:hypothetical protein